MPAPTRGRPSPMTALAACWLLTTIGANVSPIHAQDAPVPDDLTRWTLVEEVRIGAIEGRGYDLTPPTVGLVPRGDGLLVIPQTNPPELRLFSEDGEFIRSFGRRGDGPGEFQAITSGTRWRGDSLVVNGPQGRLAWFSEEGVILRTARISNPAVPIPGLGLLRPRLYLDDGTVLAEPRAALDGQEIPLLRVSVSGEVLDTLAWLPAPRASGRFVHLRSSVGVHPVPTNPFPPTPAWTRNWGVAPDGHLVALLGGVRDGTGGIAYTVRALEPTSGRLLFERDFVVAGPEVRERVGPSQFEAWVTSTVDLLVEEGVSRREARRLATSHVEGLVDDPEARPWSPVQDVLVGTDHRIWLHIRTPREDGHHWRVLDGETGEPLGEVLHEETYRLGAASERHVWLIDWGPPVPQVMRYRLEEPR